VRTEVPARTAEAPHTAPPAEILLEETVTALAAELKQRTVDAAQIRGGLAAAQSELVAQAARHHELEATLVELRVELDRLRAQVADQHHELRERALESAALRRDLAAAGASRESVTSEATGLRSELGRISSELGVTREQVQSESGHLAEASRLLADARALADGLRTDEPRS
jgi:chromosome segregation ATPase